MLLAAGKIAGHGHSQGSGERCARVAGSERIVFALGAEHEAIQPARLANCLKAIQPPGQNLMDVGLVAHIEEELVLGRIEDRVQRQRQLHHSQIGTQVTTGLRQSLNQEFADLRRQLFHLGEIQALQIGRRMDGREECSHLLPSPGKESNHQRSGLPNSSGLPGESRKDSVYQRP